MLCWALACVPSLAMAGPETPPQQVLLVHSVGRDFVPFSQALEGFRSELSRVSPQPVEFFESSLEMARFDGVEQEEALVVYLESVVRRRKPDLVVPFGAPAVLFCQRNRTRLFADVPALAVGADKRRIAGLAEEPWFTSVHVELDLPGLARGIRRLQPELQHLHVVIGTTPMERFWESQLRLEWPAALPGVEIHWLSDKSLPEIERRIARLPKNSAVFHGIMVRDAAGVAHEFDNALAGVRQASRAPVFGYAEEQLGAGIVGGSLVSMRQCGHVAAGVAVRLLAGESPSEITTQPLKPGSALYDWRELDHWNIPLSRLPAGSTVLHQPPGLWETHRTAVVAAGVVLVLQSIWIGLLAAARKRVRESGQELRLATEVAKVGLWNSDARDSNRIQASPEWRELFDLPGGGSLRVADVFERIHPDDLSMVREFMNRALSGGLEYEIEHRIVRSDGEVRWIGSRGRAEAASGAHRARTRGASLDITQRKRAEAELAERRLELAHLGRAASLGELSGALAHELNQPLGSILSNAQAALRLLARDDVGHGELHEILNDIVAEDQRAASVIQRLRALLERGETSPELLDLHHCIEEVISLLAAELLSKEVTVVRQLAVNLPRIHADPVQMQQVLLNLIINACEATAANSPGERRITLRTGLSAGMVSVEVEDNGCGFGVPPEECFRPFHTGKPRGLGMGLAICQSILLAHHGVLSAVSPACGGAVLRFSMPAAALQ